MRGVSLEELTPREAADRVLQMVGQEQQVALVFGNERSGLSNDEIQLCHAAVHIPSDPTYSSLNLSQAVQVLAYELRMRVLDGVAPRQGNSDPAATTAELEGFFEHLAATLRDIDFHKGRSERPSCVACAAVPASGSRPARTRVLRGIFADAQRMAALAARASSQGGSHSRGASSPRRAKSLGRAERRMVQGLALNGPCNGTRTLQEPVHGRASCFFDGVLAPEASPEHIEGELLPDCGGLRA